MALGERLAVSVAPLFLRLGLGITFIWAGMGKFMATMPVQGEDAAILANVGVIKPQWSAVAPAPARAPAESPGAVVPPPPTPTQPLPPTTIDPEDPRQPLPKDPAPTAKPKGAPKADKAAGKTKAMAGPGFTVMSAAYQPPGVLKAYTGAEFPEKMDVPRLHGVTLILIKGNLPPPEADGSARMALVPDFAARGTWPVTFAYCAAVAESLGGAFLIVGLFTRLSALAVGWTIAAAGWLTVIGPAIQNHHTVYGFIPAYPIFDPELWTTPLLQLTLFTGSLALFFAGPGGLSLDRLIFSRSKQPAKPPAAKPA